jgi:small nuclear ribonucleoprotein (snRNP)-like protein
VRRRVLVNLLSGRAVEGVLVRRDGPLVVLKDAHLHEPGAEHAAVDGDVVIERAQIDFIQAL